MKVIICGGGIAGLALAQRLDRFGIDVVLLERAPGPRPQGYMIDFFGPGYDAAEAMGVLGRVKELGYAVSAARYIDETGKAHGTLTYDDFAKALDGRLVSVMRPDVERALRESLSDAVDLRFSTAITSAHSDADGVRVSLDDGTSLDADLLVGADGIHSTVRRLVFGDEQNYLRYLGYHTAAFVFEAPKVHGRLENDFCLTDTVNRQMGLYGLRDGRVAAFTVHRAADPTLPDDARQAVRNEYADLGWLAPTALAQCPPHDEVYYDQVAQTIMPAWSRERTVLIGDACHAVSLLAGQGVSLGIAGAYVLADQLSGTGSLADALGRYEQLWRPSVEEKQRAGRSAAAWFVPSSRSGLLLRRAILASARLPGVSRLVAGSLAGKPTPLIRRIARGSGGLEKADK